MTVQVSEKAVLVAQGYGQTITLRIYRKIVKCCAVELVPVAELGAPQAPQRGLVARRWDQLQIYCPDWMDELDWTAIQIDVAKWPRNGRDLVVKGWRPSPWKLSDYGML